MDNDIKKLPVGSFKGRVEETSQFDKDFIKSNSDNSDMGHFTEAGAQYPEALHELHNYFLLLSEKIKIERLKNLQPTYLIKKNVIHK